MVNKLIFSNKVIYLSIYLAYILLKGGQPRRGNYDLETHYFLP